jgi:hypothetical protein
MVMLVFFRDLWKIFIDYLSLFSAMELIVVIAFLVLLCFFVDWGMNPKKYESR